MDKTDPKLDNIFLNCMGTIGDNTNEIKTYIYSYYAFYLLLVVVLIYHF